MEPGTRLGPYEIVSRIGAGGVGEVWRARDTRLDRDVAIKFLARDVSADKQRRARFDREARTLAALSHPNVGSIFDVGEVGGQQYLVLERVEGESLSGRVGAAWDIRELVDTGLQLVDALDAAHRSGIIHRDVKPANIIMTPARTVKLVDFGIAKLVDRETVGTADATDAAVTSAGTVIGTAAYMSPEQIRGEPIDARADLFSLGVVLYELATGSAPFSGASTALVWQAVLTNVPVKPRLLNAQIPESLQRIILKAMEKDRALRYASAGEMGLELLRVRETLTAGVQNRGANETSIAVLPFEDLGPDAGNAYFADGLTEEVIADLSGVRALRVISRTSSMLFKGVQKSIPEISRELNVQYVLEGSVRRSGNDVRITAQLIDAAADHHLWAEKYSGTIDRVFDLQEQLSRKIVDALKVTLAPDERERLLARPISDVRAYEAWLRAKHEASSVTEAGLARSEALLGHALEIVGENALLYAALAYQEWMAYDGGFRHDEETLSNLDSWAAKAMRLDPQLPQALFAMGLSRYKHGDMQGFVTYAKRAAELDQDADALTFLGFVLAETGRPEEALWYADRAVARDPLPFMPRLGRAVVDLFEGRFVEAIDMLQTATERIAPSDPFMNWWVGHSMACAGREAEACERFDIAALSGAPLWSGLSEIGRCAIRDDVVAVRTAMEQRPSVRESAATDELYPTALASYLARAGEHDQALHWLERAVGWGFTNHRFLSVHNRLFVSIREDPRFHRIVETAREKERAFIV